MCCDTLVEADFSSSGHIRSDCVFSTSNQHITTGYRFDDYYGLYDVLIMSWAGVLEGHHRLQNLQEPLLKQLLSMMVIRTARML